MDTTAILLALYDRKRLLEETISALEELNGNTRVRTRSPRGRKSMGAEERKQVSERMKRYWAKRRKQRTVRS